MNGVTKYIEGLSFYRFANDYSIIITIILLAIGIFLSWWFLVKRMNDVAGNPKDVQHFQILGISSIFIPLLCVAILGGIANYGINTYPEQAIKDKFGENLEEHVTYLKEHNNVIGKVTYDVKKKKDNYEIIFSMEVENNQDIDSNNKNLAKEITDSVVYDIKIKHEGNVKNE